MLPRTALIAVLATLVAGEHQQHCRILPSDPSWPAAEVWKAFNQSIDGRLIKTIPIGSPCHDPTYNEAECKYVRDHWHIPSFQFVAPLSRKACTMLTSRLISSEPHPSSVMDYTFLDKGCDPFDPREKPCRIGGYVQYAVNISRPEHVIKTVNFVKEHNIRFVVKNTGHDYLGRSTAIGAVSVWMHNLQGINFLPQYESSEYSGPAFKVHAGAIGYDLAVAADKKGFVTVSGECPTVGFSGGYLQGGGHSTLTSMYGLAADHTLEFEVITTQGEFVRASPTSHQDLYWALSGGGGGTYGVVWSVTIKPQQDLPVTIGSIEFTSEGVDPDTWWKAIDAYQASTPALTDAKVFGIAVYDNTFFKLNPVFAVNKSASEVSTLLQPLLATLDGLKIKYKTAVNTYDGYLEAYNTLTFLIDFKIADYIFGSRLLPRQIAEGGGLIHEFIQRAIGPGKPDNAVLPAWREAERHLNVLLPLKDGDSLETVARGRKRISNDFIPALKQLAPGSGAYINEVRHMTVNTGILTDWRDSQADPYEPDFKEAFYGPNYGRLLEIKDKWDPEHILYGSVAVGGDRWKQTEEGRLCRAEIPARLVDQTSYHGNDL
ncbi:hypothetical protein AAF712_008585 [Marasmius tenuissimus]|uniref:FAD-binding PCMH-type domain-containing protein n=1 Tax=Marasmius tenuissimus TaxID=585030 RepID=A0ABR2ZS73_9AGAR